MKIVYIIIINYRLDNKNTYICFNSVCNFKADKFTQIKSKHNGLINLCDRCAKAYHKGNYCDYCD